VYNIVVIILFHSYFFKRKYVFDVFNISNGNIENMEEKF